MRTLKNPVRVGLLVLAASALLAGGIGASQTSLREAPGSPVPIAALSPKDVAIGDFNNDGLPDLAVASLRCNKAQDPRCDPSSRDGMVSLLVGDGRGGFEEFVQSERVRSPYGVPGAAKAIVAADFDKDGNLDVAVGISGKVVVRRGRGDFQLYSPKIISLGGAEPTDLAVGDFNGDGNVDIVTADLGDNVFLLLGDGEGSFRTPAKSPVGNAPQGLVVADLNSDGNLDVATANTDKEETVSVLLGDGTGEFAVSHIQLDTTVRGIAAADFDGDGNMDLAVVSPVDDAVIVLLGNGDGDFNVAGRFNAGQDPIRIAAADLNRDGNADAAVVNSKGLTVLRGSGNGALRIANSFETGKTPVGLAIGDLNHDRKLDVVVANQSSNDVTILLGQ